MWDTVCETGAPKRRCQAGGPQAQPGPGHRGARSFRPGPRAPAGERGNQVRGAGSFHPSHSPAFTLHASWWSMRACLQVMGVRVQTQTFLDLRPFISSLKTSQLCIWGMPRVLANSVTLQCTWEDWETGPGVRKLPSVAGRPGSSSAERGPLGHLESVGGELPGRKRGFTGKAGAQTHLSPSQNEPGPDSQERGGASPAAQGLRRG